MVERDDDTRPRCVIPAAGGSTRMGAWKPLLPWVGGTVCGAAVRSALDAGCRPIVVTGHRGDELESWLRDAFEPGDGVVAARNPRWEEGMLGSILVGAELASGDGFLVAPGDMPSIPAAAYRAVLGAVDRGVGAVFAARRGRLGHPVWIPRGCLSGMRALDRSARLREFLLAGPWTSAEVDSDDIFEDLDTYEEYERGRTAALGNGTA